MPRATFPPLLAGLAVCLGAAAPAPQPTEPPSAAIVRDLIWSREQAIYAGRTRGDIQPYVSNVAEAYVSWPPGSATPLRRSNLAGDLAKQVSSSERLTLTFMDFTLSGDVAVIYYRTHRTVRADGSPSDDRFDVTHTWVRQAPDWKLIGGMARATAAPKPQAHSD